jgi:outer membrane protein assembly factor BamB
MRLRRAVPLLLLPGLLAGCSAWSTVTGWFQKDDETVTPPAPLVEFQQTVNVVKLWSEGTGSGTDEQYLKLSPVVADQRIYAVDTDGRLTAMDATNGQQIWSKDIDARITGGPGYGEKTVLVGTSEGYVMAFNADNGKKLWRVPVSSEVLSAPQRKGDTVVVRTVDGKVFGLNAENGERQWVYDRSVPPLTLRGTSNPVIDGDTVIAGFDGGRLAALDLGSGRVLWETRVATAKGSSELERMVDIDSEPIVIDGVIYVASFQGQLAAVREDSGRLLWSRDISSYAGFSADTANIYVTDADSNVLAYDRYTGSVLWKQKKLHNRAVTAPAVIGNYLVVGDLAGYLHWMDKRDGHFVARTRVSDERIIAAPLVVGSIVYAYDTDGELAAYTFR